ncbi:adenosylcobinamide-phosphate synthase CbiB [Pseudahrensia aquimaris]|uniref:Cobalamin biosynthesis protein CobD n=1 Tax=Pseudahrensia aquimaris TaxID=744461 RepID=A0ABW3FGZ9_9HYPH
MLLLTIALALDWFIGEPDVLWRRVPHPVVLFGKVIDWFDEKRDDQTLADRFRLSPDRLAFWMGIVLLAALLTISILISSFVQFLYWPFGWLLELAIVTILVAQKSLKDHVQDVADALKRDGVEGGRKAVSMIVGRDVSQLDESGVSKAAVESLAENASDGVVAPVLWYALAGLPGIIFYKAVNTADSMIGHRNERYEYFGKAAARLDDVMNWPAARLTALLVAGVVAVRDGIASAGRLLSITARDAPSHRSPNAGWPETAFAVALGLALGGPRRYGDDFVSAPQLNVEGRGLLSVVDVSAALGLFSRLCFALIGLCGLLALVG